MTNNEKTKVELAMENMHLRSELADANIRADWFRDQLRKYRANLITENERRILDMWPRFEDGEPVMPGDKTAECGEVSRVCVTYKTAYFNESHRSDLVRHPHGERVKRHAPEVLDADGVPINAGDIVRHVKTGVKFTVAEVSDGGLLRFEETDGVFPAPDMLTHRLMDGWEKLLRDAHETIKREFPADMRDKLDDFIDDTVFHARGIAEVE